MSVMKIRYEKLGGHYHCDVFSARAKNLTYAKNGELVFDEREWEDVRLILAGVDFVESQKASQSLTPHHPGGPHE